MNKWNSLKCNVRNGWMHVLCIPQYSVLLASSAVMLMAASPESNRHPTMMQPLMANVIPQIAEPTTATAKEAEKKIKAIVRVALDKSERAERFRQLNTYYVGRNTSKKVDWSNVDLADNLRKMWAHKLANFDATPATRKNIGALVKRWQEEGVKSTTLEAFIPRVNTLVVNAHNSLDYPKLCDEYRLDSDRCVRLQYMAGGITGNMTVAYGMTELFPSLNGEVNRNHLSGMLYYAGESYLNSIPALGDPLLSYGFYQFTSYAVRHDADGREGANKIAQFAGKGQGIAGSVLYLNNDQQHRAALYFAVHNLAGMIKNLTPGQYKVLKRTAPISREDLTVFMATSHHAPMLARRNFQHWLEAGAPRGELRKHMRGRLINYANKSRSNLTAIKNI